jgi:anion-transporting  ArsA/GET3 family ATPase
MAIRDILKENTLLRWAIRGYGLYQKIARSGRLLSGLFGNKEKMPEAPDIDIEALFAQLSDHVGQIHELLSDANKTTLCIVTLPEKLPVEETIDLYNYVTSKLSIRVGYIVVNKLQPDAMGDVAEELERLAKDPATLTVLADALREGGYHGEMLERLLRAGDFNEVRRSMNLEHLAELERRLPDVPKILLPLHRRDVSGLDKLETFQTEFFRTFESGTGPATKGHGRKHAKDEKHAE